MVTRNLNVLLNLSPFPFTPQDHFVILLVSLALSLEGISKFNIDKRCANFSNHFNINVLVDLFSDVIYGIL